MAQWVGYGSGRTHDSRVADAEVSLRRAIEALFAVGPNAAAHERKNVLRLAEKLLAARTRQLKARLSQRRERLGSQKEPDPQALVSMETSITEIQTGGVAAILREFGAGDVETDPGSRANNSPPPSE